MISDYLIRNHDIRLSNPNDKKLFNVCKTDNRVYNLEMCECVLNLTDYHHDNVWFHLFKKYKR